MNKIAAAFVSAKKDFGPALKDRTNPAFKSKYADLGSCIDAVEPALLANGIALIQETFEDATGVTVETVFIHESGESIRCGRLHVPASKQDPQGYGSALTYARRYSLCAACGIAPEDDDGNAASKQKAVDTKGKTDGTSAAETAKRITAESVGNPADVALMMSAWGTKRINEVWAFLPPDTQDILTAAWPKQPVAA